jgi:hypothetical protein
MPLTETTSRDVQEAARAIGLQIQVLNATTIGEIEEARLYPVMSLRQNASESSEYRVSDMVELGNRMRAIWGVRESGPR